MADAIRRRVFDPSGAKVVKVVCVKTSGAEYYYTTHGRALGVNVFGGDEPDLSELHAMLCDPGVDAESEQPLSREQEELAELRAFYADFRRLPDALGMDAASVDSLVDEIRRLRAIEAEAKAAQPHATDPLQHEADYQRCRAAVVNLAEILGEVVPDKLNFDEHAALFESAARRLRAIEADNSCGEALHMLADAIGLPRSESYAEAAGRLRREIGRLLAVESRWKSHVAESAQPQPPAVSKAELRERVDNLRGARASTYGSAGIFDKGFRDAVDAVLRIIDSLPDAPEAKPWRAYVVKYVQGGVQVAKTLRDAVEFAQRMGTVDTCDEILVMDDTCGIVPRSIGRNLYSRNGEWLPAEEIADE